MNEDDFIEGDNEFNDNDLDDDISNTHHNKEKNNQTTHNKNNNNKGVSSYYESENEENDFFGDDDSKNEVMEGKITEQERLYYFYENFDQNQKIRYDKFNSSSFEHRRNNKSTQKLECPRIKKVVQNLLGEGVNISECVQVILHGVAKVYAGELVEEAKAILVDEKERKINEKKNSGEDEDNNKEKEDINEEGSDEEKKEKEDKGVIGKKRYYSPIRPRHLREARRRMIRRGILPLVLNKNNSIFKKKKIV